MIYFVHSLSSFLGSYFPTKTRFKIYDEIWNSKVSPKVGLQFKQLANNTVSARQGRRYEFQMEVFFSRKQILFYPFLVFGELAFSRNIIFPFQDNLVVGFKLKIY